MSTRLYVMPDFDKRGGAIEPIEPPSKLETGLLWVLSCIFIAEMALLGLGWCFYEATKFLLAR